MYKVTLLPGDQPGYPLAMVSLFRGNGIAQGEHDEMAKENRRTDGGVGGVDPLPGVSPSLPAADNGQGSVGGWLRAAIPADESRSLGCSDTTFGSRYPALREWLTLEVLDGVPRKTTTLLTFFEEGCFKGCLNDREGDRVLFRSSDTFLGLLESLEKALRAPHQDWRARKGGKSR